MIFHPWIFRKSTSKKYTLCCAFEYTQLQYSFHDGYIVHSNARSRKRLNPTLFPHLSHAKPMLNPRSARAGISCSVKTITLALASALIQAHLIQFQVKMLELSKRKILIYMIYNWLIMFSQNTNKLQSIVWFCSVLVFPTAKPQTNLHNLVKVFVVHLTYSTRSLEES